MVAVQLIKRLKSRFEDGKAYHLLKFLSEADIGDFRASDSDLAKNLEQIYEIEYKYSMLKNRPFEGLPKRLDNIIKYLEQKANRIIRVIAEQLEDVYYNWLTRHAITKPDVWAKARFEDTKDYDDDDPALAAVSEYSQYTGGHEENFFYNTLAKIRRKLQYIPEAINIAFEDVIELDRSELQNYIINRDEAEQEVIGLEKQVKEIEAKIKVLKGKTDLSSDDENELDNLEKEYNNLDIRLSDAEADLTDAENDVEEAEERVKDYNDFDLGDRAEAVMGFEGDRGLTALLNTLVDISGYDVILEFYEYFVFPVWFGFWKPKGIVHTRKRIEKAHKELVKIEREGFKNASSFAKLNEIINVTHQTGMMIDYVEEVYPDVNYDFLQHLSNLDTKAFDKDLKKVGVKL